MKQEFESARTVALFSFLSPSSLPHTAGMGLCIEHPSYSSHDLQLHCRKLNFIFLKGQKPEMFLPHLREKITNWKVFDCCSKINQDAVCTVYTWIELKFNRTISWIFSFFSRFFDIYCTQVCPFHRLNMGFRSCDVHSYSYWLRPRNPPPPAFWRTYEGAICQLR